MSGSLATLLNWLRFKGVANWRCLTATFEKRYALRRLPFFLFCLAIGVGSSRGRPHLASRWALALLAVAVVSCLRLVVRAPHTVTALLNLISFKGLGRLASFDYLA